MSDTTATLTRWRPFLLSVFRIVVGLLFLEHGTAKLLGFPHNPTYDHMEFFTLEGAGAVCELVGGFLVAIGLFTRVAAFLVSGEMAIGYFLFHAGRNFFPLLNGGESAILFCFAFLYLVFAGPGPWSVDARTRSGGTYGSSKALS